MAQYPDGLGELTPPPGLPLSLGFLLRKKEVDPLGNGLTSLG